MSAREKKLALENEAMALFDKASKISKDENGSLEEEEELIDQANALIKQSMLLDDDVKKETLEKEGKGISQIVLIAVAILGTLYLYMTGK